MLLAKKVNILVKSMSLYLAFKTGNPLFKNLNDLHAVTKEEYTRYKSTSSSRKNAI